MRTPYMNKAACVISILLTLLAVPVAGQTVLPPAYQVVLDSNGDPVSGAQVEVYQAGTVIAAPTYADAALAVPNPWPLVADAAGRFVAFVSSGQTYKVIFKDAAGAVLKTVDGVQAIPSSSGNVDLVGVAGEALLAGDVVYLSDGSGGLVAGKWYKADADNTYSSTLPSIGVAPSPLAADATGTIRLAGLVEDLAGLVVGATYYVSATAGGMTSVAPANARLLGQADSVTSLVLQLNTAAPLIPIASLTGAWTAPAFDAADFTGNAALTWTVAAGDVTTFAYQILGKTMIVSFQVLTSTVGGVANTTLQIEIPEGKLANRAVLTLIRVNDNAAGYAAGLATVTAGSGLIGLRKLDGSNWTLSGGTPDSTSVQGQIVFEIQ